MRSCIVLVAFLAFCPLALSQAQKDKVLDLDRLQVDQVGRLPAATEVKGKKAKVVYVVNRVLGGDEVLVTSAPSVGAAFVLQGAPKGAKVKQELPLRDRYTVTGRRKVADNTYFTLKAVKFDAK